MADIDDAKTVLVVGTDPLHSMPILDLRLRKAMRNHGTRVAVVSERPTALDGGSEETLRYAPGEAATVLSDLAAELASSAGGSGGEDASRIAGALDPGNTVVIYGERIGHGPDGERALAALQRMRRRAQPVCRRRAASSRCPRHATRAACARWAACRPRAPASPRRRRA